MSRKVSATEAARHFSDLMNRVRFAGETFVVVRGGEEIARISPAPRPLAATLSALLDALERTAPIDTGFATDLAEIQATQPGLGEPLWRS